MTTTRLATASKVPALGRCNVFARIPADTVGVLAEMMETESLRAGDLLFEHGEASDRVYDVVSGTLSVLVPGRQAPVRSLGSGELLGEYGMFAQRTRTATVRAEEDAVVLSLEHERFVTFLHQFPEAMFALLATAVSRLVEAERKE